MVDVESVIDRAKQVLGVRFDSQLAKALKLSQSNFCNQKNRGTLVKVLLQWAEEKEVDIQWLLYGVGQPKVTGKLRGLIKNLGETIVLTEDEAILLVMLRELPKESQNRHMVEVRHEYLRHKK